MVCCEALQALPLAARGAAAESVEVATSRLCDGKGTQPVSHASLQTSEAQSCRNSPLLDRRWWPMSLRFAEVHCFNAEVRCAVPYDANAELVRPSRLFWDVSLLLVQPADVDVWPWRMFFENKRRTIKNLKTRAAYFRCLPDKVNGKKNLQTRGSSLFRYDASNNY